MAIVAKDDSLQIEKVTLGPSDTNAYIVVCRQTQASVLIDTPAEADRLLDRLKGTKPKTILITHNHQDHLGALAEIYSRLKVPLAAHALDSAKLPVKPDTLLNDGDILSVGNLKIGVLHTPGHTPGSVCFKVARYLIAGDTIFPGGPGKTRTPADLKQIIESITGKIFVLPDNTPVHPGHGESTVLEKEKKEFALFSSRSHDPNLCGDVLWLSS
ncbi:MAG: MBL fold metallo-hydrolase [Dehalococcoidales bacterium]|nr:MBL fold metallo-hydrolase [Dehalococcoidales bacterium]